MPKSASKIIDFIKYNNATMIIFAVIFIFGAGVFAAEPDAIGQKQTRVEGVDNSLLLTVDLESHDMDFKIEKIESDEKYFFVTFTYLDISAVNNAWQYGIREKTIKVSRDLEGDLGVWLADEFKDIRGARIKNLSAEKEKALAEGLKKREEVTEYSGLIGKTLDLAGAVFPGYSPVKKIELPATADIAALTAAVPSGTNSTDGSNGSDSDSLTEIYNSYIAENDPDSDNIFGANDNCPNSANSGQEDTDADGIGDACDSGEGSANGENSAAADGAETQDVNAGEGAETPLPSGDNAGSGNNNSETGENAQTGQSEPEDVKIMELPGNPAPASESDPVQAPVAENGNQ
ncbi:MAG: hypothetical protein WC745_02405 [Patescibacteria group bacterium]|jgi:hypothetical protein